MITAMLAALGVQSDNMLVNGDFEMGDLTGWHEEGPSYYSWRFQSWAALPVPAQVYSVEAPMSVMEIWYDRAMVRHIRRVGLAEEVRPKPGSKHAMGWARCGWEHMGYPWISQVFSVAPGKYLMNASWDVAVWNKAFQGEGSQHMANAGMFMVHVDDHVGEYTLEETTYRKTVWNTESKGRWVSRSIENFLIETRTGKVEVRLEYLQSKMNPHATEPLFLYPDYEYVTFDNVRFELVPCFDELSREGKQN